MLPPFLILVLTPWKRSLETEKLANAGPRPPLKLSLGAAAITSGQDRRAADKYDELSRALFAEWPSQRDLDLILSVPAESSFLGLSHGVVCIPYSTFACQDAPSLRDILQLPPPGVHPLLIARKLLILGTFLQSLPPCSGQNLGLRASYRDIMFRLVEKAYSLVICNDELVDSIEGIECIMMESMCQNSLGNLRRSWLAMRRAMLIAQMMGLHRRDQANSASHKFLEPDTQRRINPEHMWFRLVQSDRYLSLMLGLPQGSIEDGFATSKALEGCMPPELIQRIHCVAAGRILQRNEADMQNIAMMHEIDGLLQKASTTMPPKWWLIPNLTSSASDGEAFLETIRLMDQLTHYHLLAQLHLPYLLRFSTDHKYDYSKITAINASREVLTRFVSFRSANPVNYYCRGIDFLAFIASTALCLAHIDARRQRQVHAGDGGGGTVIQSLAHQRQGDLGMMERALDSMEHMARASTNSDVIASKIASILRHLLVIEADATNGGSYSTDASPADGEDKGPELECGGNASDGGNVLHIYIPYFGTIKIERCGISRSVLAVPLPPEEGVPRTPVPGASNSDPAVSSGLSLLPEREDEHGQQPLATATSPTGYQVGGQSVNPDWLAVPSHFGPLVLPQQPVSAAENDELSNFNGSGAQEAHLLVPGLDAGADDWALQGVDLALFDSLIRGAAVQDEGEEESWMR